MNAFILLINCYQKLISPILGPRCRFYPSCSNYSKDAITQLGIARGLIMSIWRILRCNPLSEGGYDPVIKRKRK